MFSADTWGALSAWDYATATDKPKWSLPAAHNGWIHSLAVNADGSLLATSGLDRAIRVWSSADGAMKHELLAQPDSVQTVMFHPTGALVTGDMKGIVRQWDLASGKCMREINAALLYKEDRLQEVGGVRSLATDSIGAWLAVTGIALGRVAGGWQAHRAAIYSSVSFTVVVVLYLAFRMAETNGGGRFL